MSAEDLMVPRYELEKLLAEGRLQTIEECACVAENCEPTPDGDDPYCTNQIAAAIRALKDK